MIAFMMGWYALVGTLSLAGQVLFIIASMWDSYDIVATMIEQERFNPIDNLMRDYSPDDK